MEAEEAPMRSTTILAIVFVAMGLGSTAFAQDADPAGSCRCMTPLSGEGISKDAKCDGFEPDTHRECACEKLPLPDHKWTCVPKAQAQSAPPAQHAVTKPPHG
jgi:hypothetical protein